jgi:two-component system, NarL family, nitrate/nitrite response regulator NarL
MDNESNDPRFRTPGWALPAMCAPLILWDHGVVALSVVIVDDSASFLESARALLHSQGMDVLGVASTPVEAVACVQRLSPDVVVVDLHLGAASGLEIAEHLSTQGPDAPAVVLVSSIGYDDLAALAAEAPVRGFLTKTDLSAAAVEAIVQETPLPG